ncbi:MAG: hypothetical protein J6U40_12080 [Kiritimatiellae bacterium]|nr:hypothetical protein [Kiritimatiellia bacterium]
MMRCWDLVAAAIWGTVCGAMADTPSVLADFTHEGHGWKERNHAEKGVQTPTGYRFEVTGVDPWFVSEAFIPLPERPPKTAFIRFALETGPLPVVREFQLFWRKRTTAFNEADSIRLKAEGKPPYTRFTAEWPSDRIPKEPLMFRIDPPNRRPGFETVELRSFSLASLTPIWGPPAFTPPPPLAWRGEPVVLTGRSWKLEHDPQRMGAFRFTAGGKAWAEGYADECIVLLNADGEPETLPLQKGTFAFQKTPTTLETKTRLRDASGRTWHWMRQFSRSGDDLIITTRVLADSPARILHLPYLTLLADRASAGRKTQALLAGIEYLADEPSSSEKELRGPQANRLIPAPHKFCYPMMALADASAWFACEWESPKGASRPFSVVFDSPDRQFKSGGHLLGFWAPAVDAGRHENDLRIFTAMPFTVGEMCVVLSHGVGGDVAAAMAGRIDSARLPEPPRVLKREACELLARGWLDSSIRKETRFRHAIGNSWTYIPACDAPTMMLWLASTLGHSDLSDRLTRVAEEAIAQFPQEGSLRKGWGGTVSHIRRPAPALVFGDPIAFGKAHAAEAASLLKRCTPDGKRIWRKPENAPRDLGSTLGTDHCNGYSAMEMEPILMGALWTGNEELIAAALKRLDAFTDLYGNDVPRGAQPWEMPLHTPDILASGRLVQLYVYGYLLSGNTRYLDRARYWAYTGLSMVYLVDPPIDNAGKAIGRYATCGVMGATNWVSPNWIGLPVQWCGLVYSMALAELAEIEPYPERAVFWRKIAEGITASGVQQSHPASDGERVGLLPDSFSLIEQTRNAPPINPGTVQANVMDFCGKPYYRCAVANRRILVHAPGAVTPLPVDPGEQCRVRIDAWPRKPYKILFTRIAKPAAVLADGQPRPFVWDNRILQVEMPADATVVTVKE